MDQSFEKRRLVAHGPTTRVVELTTGERVKFAPEALHGMVRQVREGFVSMTVEHLNIFPPIGRWSDGEVIDLADGEQQVLLYGDLLQQYVAQAETEDPFQKTTLDAHPAPGNVEASIGVEVRNFERESWTASASECPLPVRELQKWSSLPPIEWVLTVPVVWGATKFLGSFLDRLGSAASDALVGWLKATSRKAREPDRDRYITLSFDLDDGRQVLGFVPFAADDEDMLSVTVALDSAGTLAEVAGRLQDAPDVSVHRVAYVYAESEWRLAWYVTDAGAFCSKYFSKNMPDPERFLGRPLLPELPAD